MRIKIQKWGHSSELKIPRTLAEAAGVRPGSEVDISLRDGELVVKPFQRRAYRLKDLLRRITPRNVHAGIETGTPVGEEVW